MMIATKRNRRVDILFVKDRIIAGDSQNDYTFIYAKVETDALKVYTTLHYTTLHYTTLHYTTLHSNTKKKR